MDPTARAHELIDVTVSLTALLDQENTLLTELRVKEIGALQQEKTSLSGLYELRIREAVQDAGVFNAVAPEVRDRLRLASEAFDQSAQQNARALRAALEMNTRMVHKIAQLATKQETRPNGYAANGTTPYAARRGKMSVIPMTLNEQL
jgi:hypothetical protein